MKLPAFKKMISPIALMFILTFAIAILAGCGGGGGGGAAGAGDTGGGNNGGGTTTPPPPTTPKDPPVQSAWSPASNSVLTASSFVLTLSTDVNASCRWALQDLAYSGMQNSCSGGSSKSHSCSVSGLVQGTQTVYVACSGVDGEADTALTNDELKYTVDSVKPSLSFDYPLDDADFTFFVSDLSYISLNYSDSGTGISVSTLQVTYEVEDRTIDITSMFGKDATANSSTSRTSVSETAPLSRTTVSRFSNTAFTAPSKSWAFPRGNKKTLRVSNAGAGSILVWNREEKGVYLINTSSSVSSLLATLSAFPVDVVVSPASNRFYVVYSGDKKLYAYNLASGASVGTGALSGTPIDISYNSTLNKVYVSFSDLQELAVWDCAGSAFGTAISLDHTPVMIEAWDDNTGKVVTVSGEVAGHKVVLVDSGGARLVSQTVAVQKPRGLFPDPASGYIFASVTTSSGTPQVAAVKISDSSVSNITDIGPGNIFHGASSDVIVLGEDQWDASVLNTSTLLATTPASLGVPPSGGVYDSSSAGYYIAEDLFLLPSLPITITASIKDTAGNKTTTSVSITMHPESN